MVTQVMEFGENSPANPEVLNKYQTAADIANRTLTFALTLIKSGASVLDICTLTDAHLTTLASQTHKKAKILKGIAFPCCVSVNNTLCHFAPTEGDITLREGDVVKIELGAHIDGFPALVGTTTIVGATEERPAEGPAADLVRAAAIAADAAVRLVREGGSSVEVASALKGLVKDLGFTFIEGMISHSVGKDQLADEKMIIVNPSEQQVKLIPPCTFAPNDVFVVDIAISSGSGKVKPDDKYRPTIYARTGETYSLRLKSSRAVLSEVTSKFGKMAFNVKQLEDGNRARMALVECTQHGVTNAYEVLNDKDALTARFMFTTVLLPNGPLQITDHHFNAALIKSSLRPTLDNINALLKEPTRTSKKDKTTPVGNQSLPVGRPTPN